MFYFISINHIGKTLINLESPDKTLTDLESPDVILADVILADKILEKHSIHQFKLFFFQDEHNSKRKIRLQIV